MEEREDRTAGNRSIRLGLSREEWREFQDCVRRQGATIDGFFTEKALELIARQREARGRLLN